jgi:hypothetical protein
VHISRQKYLHRLHDNPFICCWENCPRRGKPFQKQHQLEQHAILTHVGDDLLSCTLNLCNARFRHLYDLKVRHRARRRQCTDLGEQYHLLSAHNIARDALPMPIQLPPPLLPTVPPPRPAPVLLPPFASRQDSQGVPGQVGPMPPPLLPSPAALLRSLTSLDVLASCASGSNGSSRLVPRPLQI